MAIRGCKVFTWGLNNVTKNHIETIYKIVGHGNLRPPFPTFTSSPGPKIKFSIGSCNCRNGQPSWLWWKLYPLNRLLTYTKHPRAIYRFSKIDKEIFIELISSDDTRRNHFSFRNGQCTKYNCEAIRFNIIILEPNMSSNISISLSRRRQCWIKI